MEETIKEIKLNYNYILNRYYNGCNYVAENKENADKYIPHLLKIKKELEEYLKDIMKFQDVTEQEILNGFNI